MTGAERKAVTVGLADLVGVIVACGWLLTHDGCAHPVGNLLAFGWIWVGPLGWAAWITEGGAE
jgi:hypothetical protein